MEDKPLRLFIFIHECIILLVEGKKKERGRVGLHILLRRGDVGLLKESAIWEVAYRDPCLSL